MNHGYPKDTRGTPHIGVLDPYFGDIVLKPLGMRFERTYEQVATPTLTPLRKSILGPFWAFLGVSGTLADTPQLA